LGKVESEMKKEDSKNISWVAKSNLCTGCGTCVPLCPTGAIELIIDEKKGIYVPKVNEEKCTKCGICLKVCPGHEVDFKQYKPRIFENSPMIPLSGITVNCYTGYSTKPRHKIQLLVRRACHPNSNLCA
jgi:coenzyme F420 hydrogenase subunit beta